MIDGLTTVNPLFTVTSYLGVGHGEHRRTGATASCDSTGPSDSSDQRTKPLLITGNKTRDATLGESRIRAGEIVFGNYTTGLFSVFASYVWRPGVFERSSCKQCAFQNVAFRGNPGYHAFIDKERQSARRSSRPAGRLALFAPSPCGAKSSNINVAGDLSMPPFSRSPKLLETLAIGVSNGCC